MNTSNSFLFLSIYLILSISVLAGCKRSTTHSMSTTWQIIEGRGQDQDFPRFALYRAKVPINWIKKPTDPTDLVTDTRKAIEEFEMVEGKESIRITIHNFPITSTNSSIPPFIQIQRWKRQFDELNSSMVHTEQVAHGGFSGLFFEAEGLIKGQNCQVLGWSMQLASDYQRKLNLQDVPVLSQIKADYTIKVVGSPFLVRKHRKAIELFANSFELIEELPAP